MSQLPAKDYIQTRARTLPIYKCYVSKNWAESKFAGVIVMRKHNNGNITAGFYYIDLHCLGVKGTRFYFNMPENELLEHFKDLDEMYKEADYALAHNIVYVGHDYAMDFEIGPHKDFDISRFILEEDDDNIPLLEIETGEKGKPHLIVMKANERLDALAKLKKNAGEGNYFYSVAEQQNFDEYFLDNIPIGKLDCKKVLNVETEDLEDDDKVEKRDPIEHIYIYSELFTRYLPDEYLFVEPAIDEAWKKQWIVELSYIPLPSMEKFYEGYHQALDEVISKGKSKDDDSIEAFEDNMIAVVNKYANNPVVAALFYEHSVLMVKEKVIPVAKAHAEKHFANYPMVQLSLALGALIRETPDSRFDAIYNAESIREIFPSDTVYYMPDFANFGLIKMFQRIEEGDIPFCVKYYNMIANSGGNKCALLPMVWSKYGKLLESVDIDEDEDEEDE